MALGEIGVILKATTNEGAEAKTTAKDKKGRKDGWDIRFPTLCCREDSKIDSGFYQSHEDLSRTPRRQMPNYSNRHFKESPACKSRSDCCYPNSGKNISSSDAESDWGSFQHRTRSQGVAYWFHSVCLTKYLSGQINPLPSHSLSIGNHQFSNSFGQSISRWNVQ